MPDGVIAELQQFVDRLADHLRRSRHTVVLTGAGVSAESGVPTFRDAQTGLWARYKAEQLATPEAFEADPGLVWSWYAWRREVLGTVQPNPGHHALAQLQAMLPRLTLITQNVDGLHQAAGSRDVTEFHGNISRSVCSARPCPGSADPADTDEPPVCTTCGAPMRPDVVWFGEPIPETAFAAAETAINDCDLFLSVGTSSLVYPAAGLAEIARTRGAAVVEINPDATPLTGAADLVITGKSGVVLPLVTAAMGWPACNSD